METKIEEVLSQLVKTQAENMQVGQEQMEVKSQYNVASGQLDRFVFSEPKE